MELSKLLCSSSVPLKPSFSSASTSKKAQQAGEGEQDKTTPEEDDILTPELRNEFFTMAHGRKVSSIAKQYPLPLDKEEIKVACLSRSRRTIIHFTLLAHGYRTSLTTFCLWRWQLCWACE